MTVSVGDVLSIRLPNGSFALIWVVSVEGASVEFLVLDGFWENAPDSAIALSTAPAPREGPQIPGHVEVWKGWINGGIPGGLAHCVERPLGPKEVAYAATYSGTMIFGTVARLRDTLYTRWRLKFDREALLEEWQRDAAEREARRAQRRATITLEKMLRERYSLGFSGDAPPEAVRRAKRIFGDATKDLIALRTGGTEDARREVLRRIAGEFNAIEDAGAEIDTVVREVIAGRVAELARLVGVPDDIESLLRGRDW